MLCHYGMLAEVRDTRNAAHRLASMVVKRNFCIATIVKAQVSLYIPR